MLEEKPNDLFGFQQQYTINVLQIRYVYVVAQMWHRFFFLFFFSFVHCCQTHCNSFNLIQFDTCIAYYLSADPSQFIPNPSGWVRTSHTHCNRGAVVFSLLLLETHTHTHNVYAKKTPDTNIQPLVVSQKWHSIVTDHLIQGENSTFSLFCECPKSSEQIRIVVYILNIEFEYPWI